MKKPNIIKTDTWVKPYLAKYKWVLCLAIFLGLMTYFCGSALMFTSGYTIDKSATRPSNIMLIYAPIVLTRAFGIGRPVFRYVERLTSHNWVLRVTSDLRKRLYDALEKDSGTVSQKHQTGSLLSVLSEDLGHLQNLYLRTVFPAIISYLLGALIVIALGWFNLTFGLTMLLLMVVELVVVPLWSVTIEAARRQQQKGLKDRLYTDLTDQVLGDADWKIANRHQDFSNLTTKTDHDLRVSKLKSKRFDWARDFLLQIIFGAMALALLYFTNQLFTGNQESANYVGAIVLALFPLSDAIVPVAQGFEEWTQYRDSVIRLNALQPEEKQLPEQVSIDSNHFNEIKLDKLRFTYPDETKPIIKDFCLTVKRGEKVALIGPSGAGKTTILELLLGDLDADQGSITIDDHPIASLQDERAKLFSVLNQNPFLFNTTVRQNLQMANPKATKDDMLTVLAQVQLKELFDTLPKGLDTPVQEAGARFSGGQKQRLALARVLLQDAPIILLDEPTVGLDPLTEQKLLNLLFTVLKDKTIIWITHHLQGMNYIDQVLFLKDGEIEMSGAPKELYQHNSHFHRLYQMDVGIQA